MKNVVVLLFLFAFTACIAAPVLDLTLTAPSGNITGLGFGEDYLWAIDKTTKTIYKINPLNGSVENSWACTQIGSRIPTGLTYLNGYVYICAGTATGTSAYGFRYNSSGGYIGSFSMDC